MRVEAYCSRIREQMDHYPSVDGAAQITLLRATLTRMDASDYHEAVYAWGLDELLIYMEMNYLRSVSDDMDEAMRYELDKHKRGL